ncbi:MAG: SoxR reducing system RseC family protein [Clostridium sp.]
MQEEGIIKKINGDIATVAFVKKGGCGGGCSSCKSGCPKDTILVELENTQAATIGEKVLVSMDNKVFSNMTFWAYAFPTIITVITLIICIYIFNKLNVINSEVYSVLIALVSMVISYMISAKLNRKQDKYSFKMMKKLN